MELRTSASWTVGRSQTAPINSLIEEFQGRPYRDEAQLICTTRAVGFEKSLYVIMSLTRRGSRGTVTVPF
jgi:hypothetical protein